VPYLVSVVSEVYAMRAVLEETMVLLVLSVPVQV
jgi:hypothetical protein